MTGGAAEVNNFLPLPRASPDAGRSVEAAAMRRNRTAAGWAVGLAGAALLAGAGTVHAQARGGSSGGLSGGGLGSSSGLSGSGGLSGGGLGSSSLGGGLGGGGLSGSGGLSGGSSPFGGSSGVGFMGGGGGTFGTSGGTGGGGRGGTQGYGTTGPMGPYFGNPLSLGVPATTNTTATRTRTFGTVLYNVTAQTGLTSGGGLGGTANLSTGRGMGASSYGTRRAPAYVTVLGDTVPQARADMLRVRADLQDVVARASRLPSRANIRVLTDGGTVVLRGNVVNDHERRLAESLVRLTPGVRAVRNELVTPEAAAGR
jgi:hypothetical protein